MSFADALDILYEDNHCLALNKPAGWPTTHFDGKEETVDRLAKAYLKEKYGKPGNVFLGVVHRLDKPVTGVAAVRPHEQGRGPAQRAVPRRGGREDLLGGGRRAGDSPRSRCAVGHRRRRLARRLAEEGRAERAGGSGPAEGTPGAQFARLLFQVRGRHDGLTWLELRPHTGRKHQLRVQLASRGCPIYGDAKYGSDHAFGPPSRCTRGA